MSEEKRQGEESPEPSEHPPTKIEEGKSVDFRPIYDLGPEDVPEPGGYPAPDPEEGEPSVPPPDDD